MVSAGSLSLLLLLCCGTFAELPPETDPTKLAKQELSLHGIENRAIKEIEGEQVSHKPGFIVPEFHPSHTQVPDAVVEQAIKSLLSSSPTRTTTDHVGPVSMSEPDHPQDQKIVDEHVREAEPMAEEEEDHVRKLLKRHKLTDAQLAHDEDSKPPLHRLPKFKPGKGRRKHEKERSVHEQLKELGPTPEVL